MSTLAAADLAGAMSWRKAALRLVGETLAAGFLNKVGEHLGDALGTVLGRKIDPEHCKEPASEGTPEDEVSS